MNEYKKLSDGAQTYIYSNIPNNIFSCRKYVYQKAKFKKSFENTMCIYETNMPNNNAFLKQNFYNQVYGFTEKTAAYQGPELRPFVSVKMTRRVRV